MPCVTRFVVAAALAVSSFAAVPASAEPECDEVHPCYECFMSPCYPEDWPPFLLDKVHDLLGDGSR